MRRIVIGALLLAAACGGGFEHDFHVSPVDVDVVRLRVSAGDVTIGTAAAGEVHCKATASLDLVSENRILTIRPVATKGEITMQITVPAGLALDAVCRDASVQVKGSWGRVDVRTVGGAIDIDVERLTGGVIRSDAGNVSLAVSGAAPQRDLRCESVAGDVGVALPSGHRGRLYLATRLGTVEVEPHRNLRALLGPESRTAHAFIGTLPSTAEIKAELAESKSFEAIRATSASGTVRVRLLTAARR